MDIWVSTEQKIKQNNENLKFKGESIGKLIEKRVPYLLYNEQVDDEIIKVRVKLEPGAIRISRQGAINMDFLFVEGKVTQNMYETPAGRTVMDVHTTKLEYKKLSVGGRLVIEYELSERGVSHGEFKYQLDYKERMQ
ncbi:DUF1934 domain-containing protein [Macrococcus hajekii]|uniref:DUF1934 domain-containing protein n=1 Tax=Macrococcus hajekii TaxID=198482 RepID=A0A4R6BI88_9STAP|nr:DUF1934 domain-containing protein [Macrococcus hajekii]TDM01186.1 DUF1934 domain-containing protein [Macrococcus hajekii]GGB11859.1 hypothetical protein GCM10007190_19900 [Macrococcus hajekii]